MDTKNIVTFMDSLNRCIFGERVPERCNDTHLVVKNPVVVNIVAQRDPNTGQPTGQMALQLLPIFFREFLGDKDSPVIFSYVKNNITLIDDMTFNFKLYAQYEQIFNDRMPIQQAPQPPPQGQSNIIKLFDD